MEMTFPAPVLYFADGSRLNFTQRFWRTGPSFLPSDELTIEIFGNPSDEEDGPVFGKKYSSADGRTPLSSTQIWSNCSSNCPIMYDEFFSIEVLIPEGISTVTAIATAPSSAYTHGAPGPI
jgi:hypothetical protein